MKIKIFLISNLTFVLIIFYRSTGLDGCEAKMEGIATSFNQYAIGETKATGGENPLIWFRLYPRKEDNSGWWYYKGVGNTETKLSLHSRGKNSPDHKGFVVLDNICWAKMNEIIRSSKTFETIKAEKFNPGLFGLFSKPYHKVKTIGSLNVL